MSGGEAVYRGMSAERLEHEYNPRLARPDYETTIMADWLARSEQARRSFTGRLDQPYGPSARQRFDLFRCDDPAAPTLIYIHGGYWQRGEKSLYSMLAGAFVPQGVHVAILGYDLCPQVTLGDIAAQIRLALSHLYSQAKQLGLDPNKLALSGHSAGGHLTLLLQATDWPATAPGMPGNAIKAGIALSPVVELEPLRFTSINQALGLTAKSAAALSPVPNHPPRTKAPLLIACGERESLEFNRQADLYGQHHADATHPIDRLSAAGCDHFDIVNAFCDPEAELHRATLALLRRL